MTQETLILILGYAVGLYMAWNIGASGFSAIKWAGLGGVAVFHVVRLAENIGAIADHDENAGDMMRAIAAR